MEGIETADDFGDMDELDITKLIVGALPTSEGFLPMWEIEFPEKDNMPLAEFYALIDGLQIAKEGLIILIARIEEMIANGET